MKLTWTKTDLSLFTGAGCRAVFCACILGLAAAPGLATLMPVQALGRGEPQCCPPAGQGRGGGGDPITGHIGRTTDPFRLPLGTK